MITFGFFLFTLSGVCCYMLILLLQLVEYKIQYIHFHLQNSQLSWPFSFFAILSWSRITQAYLKYWIHWCELEMFLSPCSLIANLANVLRINSTSSNCDCFATVCGTHFQLKCSRFIWLHWLAFNSQFSSKVMPTRCAHETHSKRWWKFDLMDCLKRQIRCGFSSFE